MAHPLTCSTALARHVRHLGRRYGRADRHITDYVGAATRREMASMRAGAYFAPATVRWPPALPPPNHS